MKNENILYPDPAWNKKGKALTQMSSLYITCNYILKLFLKVSFVHFNIFPTTNCIIGKLFFSTNLFPLCFGFPASKRALPKTKTAVYSCQFGMQGLCFLDVMVMLLGCIVSFWKAK